MLSNFTIRCEVMMRCWATCFWIAIMLVSTSATALPTKAECSLASKEGHTFRHAGKLSEAVQRFALCAASSCPQAMQKDCTTRLKEAKDATPRITFTIKEANGPSVSGVNVLIDGVPLATVGGPIEISVDPGDHVFDFSAEGYVRQSVKLTLRVNASLKESVILEKASPMPPSPPLPPSTAPVATVEPPAPSTPTTTVAPPPAPVSEAALHGDPTKDHLQTSTRGGATVGVGNAADFYKPQFTVLAIIGKYVNRHLFIGGYIGLGFGSSAKAVCETPEFREILSGCTANSAYSFRLGPELQQHVVATEMLDPWFGLGLGLGVTAGGINLQRKTDNAVLPLNYSALGVDLRVTSGLDVKLNNTLAIGPVIEALAGSYSHVFKLNSEDVKVNDQSSLWLWFTFGARVVLFP